MRRPLLRPNPHAMLPSQRQRALRVLVAAQEGGESSALPVLLLRDVEARCHALSHTEHEYHDHIRRAACNLHANPHLGLDVVCAPDGALTEGTLVGDIAAQRRARADRFERMLAEKYEALNDATFQSIVRCRRCGCEEVSWDEKQTRSADEGATVFCVCTRCKNRWIMR